MNTFAKEWVAALRSGKYRQTRAYLRTNEGFCCLGVACDLMAPETWETISGSVYSFRGNDANLPKEVARKLNLTYEAEDRLTVLNDDKAYTFNRIADYIEENRGNLFLLP